MAAGDVLSGKNGRIKVGGTTYDHITGWSWSRETALHAYGSNSTAGHKRKVAGMKDNSGSFTGMIHDGGAIPIDEGDAVTLQLHVDETGNNFYSVPAIVESIEVEVDINDGAPVGYTANFQGDGAYTKNGAVT